MSIKKLIHLANEVAALEKRAYADQDEMEAAVEEVAEEIKKVFFDKGLSRLGWLEYHLEEMDVNDVGTGFLGEYWAIIYAIGGDEIELGRTRIPADTSGWRDEEKRELVADNQIDIKAEIEGTQFGKYHVGIGVEATLNDQKFKAGDWSITNADWNDVERFLKDTYRKFLREYEGWGRKLS